MNKNIGVCVAFALALAGCTYSPQPTHTPTTSAQTASTGVNQLKIGQSLPRSQAVCWTPGDIPGLLVYFLATQGKGTVTATVSQKGQMLQKKEYLAYFGTGGSMSRRVEIIGTPFTPGDVDVELVGTDASSINLQVPVYGNPCKTTV